MAVMPARVGNAAGIETPGGRFACCYWSPTALDVNARVIAAAGSFTTPALVFAGLTVFTLMAISLGATTFSVDGNFLAPDGTILQTLNNQWFNAQASPSTARISIGGNTGGVGDVYSLFSLRIRNLGAVDLTSTLHLWGQPR